MKKTSVTVCCFSSW